MFDIDTIDTDSLARELDVVHLLYHRNRNQHRHSIWWKQFAILKRRGDLIVDLLRQKPQPNVSLIEVHVKYVVLKIIPRAYRLFHGVLTHGQYINLGFALIALVSRLFVLLRESMKVEDSALRRPSRLLSSRETSLKAFSGGAEEADIGQSVSRDVVEHVVGRKSQKTETESTQDGREIPSEEKKGKNKGKKKRVKNEIDAIFGL